VTASLYGLLGGAPVVHELVERLYAKLLADDAVRRYYAGVDMPRLKRHQVLMLSQLLGGPAQYDGRDLRTAHAGLDIQPFDYGIVCAHFAEALQDVQAPAEVIAAMTQVLRDVEEHIVVSPVGTPG
jgi:hemoglobin